MFPWKTAPTLPKRGTSGDLTIPLVDGASSLNTPLTITNTQCKYKHFTIITIDYNNFLTLQSMSGLTTVSINISGESGASEFQ